MTETFSKNRMFDARGVLDENDPQFGAGGLYDPNGQFSLERKAILDKNFQEQRQVHLPDASRQAMAADVGLVRTNDNSNYYTTPSMQFADVTRREARARQQLDYEKFKEIRNSVGFRIGDTLADTGRAFLSPLFWLGGEDTTRFDPSAKLEARYREGFRTNEKIREQSYLLAEQSRNQRKQALETMRLNQITSEVNVANLGINQERLTQQRGLAGLTDEDKRFRNYTVGTQGVDAYNNILKDPQAYKDAFESYNVDVTGKAVRIFPVGDRPPVVYNKTTYQEMDQIGNKFKSDAFRESIEKYEQLIAALDADSPVGNIAAVFQFMKQLDPTSVVRDSEYRVVAGAGAAVDKVKMLKRTFEEGNFLPAKIIEDLKNVSSELMQINMATYDSGRSSALNKLGILGVTEENGLAQRFLGNDVFANYRPQEPQQIDHSQYITGTADDGKNVYDRGNGTYILDDDGVTEIAVTYGEE